MTALYGATFMQIDNTSPNPEIYSVFRRITFDLYGHCILINKTETCNKAPAPEMFTNFFSPSTFPKVGTPQQFVDALKFIKGNNSYVWYPLLFGTVIGFIALCVSVFAAKVGTKKVIVWFGGIVFVTFICIIVSLGISQKVYGDLLPSVLSTPMTVTAVVNNRTVALTGTPAQLGIKSRQLDGNNYLIGSLVMFIVTLGGTLRWWFDGDAGVPKMSPFGTRAMVKV